MNTVVSNENMNTIVRTHKIPENTVDEAVIRIKYCGVWPSDVHMAAGNWGATFPCVLGHEIIGVVEKLPTSNTTNLKMNQLVGVGWQSNSRNDGGFAEYIQVNKHFIITVPLALHDYKQVPPLLCGGMTAFKPLYENYGKANRVGIVGFGGIGTLALQFAKCMYESVTVISRTNNKRQAALDGGAADYVLIDELDESTHKFDFVVICANGNVDLNKILKHMLPSGKICLLGLWGSDTSLSKESMELVIEKEISVTGTNPVSPSLYQTLFAFVQKHGIRIDVEVKQPSELSDVMWILKNDSPAKRYVIEMTPDDILSDNLAVIGTEIEYDDAVCYKYKDPEKGIRLVSKIKAKKSSVFYKYEFMYTKELTQHSLYDRERNLHSIAHSETQALPYYLEHSSVPNLRIISSGTLIAVRNIQPGDHLSLDYADSENVLFKQFPSKDTIPWVTGYQEDIDESGRKYLALSEQFEQSLIPYSGLEYTDDGLLQYNGIDVQSISNMMGTDVPLFIYSKQSIRKNIFRIKDVLFEEFHSSKLLFSVKSNTEKQMLCELRYQGIDGLDACSPNEVFRALECGFSPDQIHYTSSYLSDLDIKQLSRFDRLNINADSLTMLRKLSFCHEVGIRVNTMVGMSYCNQENLQCNLGGEIPAKMGIMIEDVNKACEIARDNGTPIVRLHVHFGNSYLSKDIGKFPEVVQTVQHAMKICKDYGFDIREIDLGGGFGVPYLENEVAFDFSKWASILKSNMDLDNIKVIIEPGDYIVKNAGMMIATVNTVEKKRNTKFVGINVGMNLNVIPAYYGVLSLPLPVVKRDGIEKVTVVGNLNESIDVWVKDHKMSSVQEGDLLALSNSGGYAESMRTLHSLRTEYRTILL